MPNGMQRIAFGAVCAALLAGCSAMRESRPARWELQEVRTLAGFRNPECVAVDPQTGWAYVTNTDAASPETVNDLDARGFVSRLSPGGEGVELRWVDSSPAMPLNSPKGACVLGGELYFNDITELKRCRIDPRGPVRVVATFPPDASLNDAATDGRYVYVSDTARGKVFRVDPATGREAPIQAPPAINGLTFRGGRLFGVNVVRDDSDLWLLDADGLLPPRRLGVLAGAVGLDGVEPLADGQFLITDVWGHRVYVVDPAAAPGSQVRTLAVPADYPADLAIDRRRGLVYVPLFFRNEVKVYKLTRAEQ